MGRVKQATELNGATAKDVRDRQLEVHASFPTLLK